LTQTHMPPIIKPSERFTAFCQSGGLHRHRPARAALSKFQGANGHNL